MSFEPNTSNFRVPPPTATSIGRFMPYMRGMVAGGFLVGATIYAATLILPNGFRPGDVAGKTAGGTLNHEIRESMEAVVERDRRVADAQAQAQAKAHIDEKVAQALIDQRVNNTAGLGAAATIADAACIAGRIGEANTQPTLAADWRQGYSGGDWYSLFQTMRRAACGVGDVAREVATASVIDVTRTVTAARGLSMTDGSVRAAAVVAQPARTAPQAPTAPLVQAVAVPRTLEEVYALPTTSHRYPWEEVMRTRQYIRALPQPVQDKLFAGLTDLPGQDWDLLVERTHAYVVLAAIK